jgi:uncharacterized surface protein with fasciclin (FAS1) repeats
VGCADITIVETTTGDANLYSYLLKYPDKYGDFAKIVEKAGYDSFLDAYGAYTMFAPNNQAVQKYLTSVGKQATSLTKEEAQGIVKLHALEIL